VTRPSHELTLTWNYFRWFRLEGLWLWPDKHDSGTWLPVAQP